MNSEQRTKKDSKKNTYGNGLSNHSGNILDHGLYNTPGSERSSDLFLKIVAIFDKELGYDKAYYRQGGNSSYTGDNVDYANRIVEKYITGISQGSDSTRTDKAGAGRSIEDEPLELRPENKTEGIFNDENLTEDYELGLRFYQMGLKTGFFNVKLDGDRNSTRIATAEFFPNKFWPAVKQRSRWIAGICLQNWKAHKWNGNLTTKYFMFRDRKPLISFMSTFLSYFVLLYFIYLGIGAAAGFDNTLVSGKISPVLMSLMMFNLVFMISKGFHRFVFTYSWYGFRYALASLFRLGIDTFINFFAIIRSISVFRKTKKQVVWDATTHY